jgi:23S rRNA (guanosine2251-2'-O)-methyltransferase
MIVYGKQIVFYILEKYPNMINEIYLAKECDRKIFHRFSQLNKKIIRPDSLKAQAMAKGGNHQGFLLDIENIQYTLLNDIKKSKFILVLDGLTDVRNIGSIVRTAYGLGVDAIVVCGIKNLNLATIARTSSGALFDMPIVLMHNVLDVVNELNQVNFTTIGASLQGIDIRELKLQNKNNIALFLGNEASGLSNKILKKLNTKVSIGMSNNFDSLNVAVATGILIHRLKG